VERQDQQENRLARVIRLNRDMDGLASFPVK
jgi:hypothetical protein